MTSHDIEASADTRIEKVWFVDVITYYGPAALHSVTVHIALEQCAELLNAEYIAAVDQSCPLFKGTEKWLRVLHDSEELHTSLSEIVKLTKQRKYKIAIAEGKNKLRAFYDLCIRIRSLIKDINNDASRIIIYLDYVYPVQILAVWLSVVSLATTRKNTVVWMHFHGIRQWKHRRFVRCLFEFFPVKAWITAYTSELVAANRKYGWIVEHILPMPLNSALNVFTRNHLSTNKIKQSDKMVCWLLLTYHDQGLELLTRMIDHKSAKNFQKKGIKCFVRDGADIKENAEIELVRLPYVSEEDYRLHFNECEVVLLPYNAHSYNGRMSMTFVEAIATSKIAIVADGTVMASELRRFELGDLIMDFNNGFSWTLINEIRNDSGIRTRLDLMAESYVKEHDTFACAQSLYKGLKKIDPKMALREPKRAR